MFYVRYTAGSQICVTAVADICFSNIDKRIEFIPWSVSSECFLIYNVGVTDFDIISDALRQCSFVNLDTLGYKVFIV